jgi:hypothetical protein
LKLQFIPTRKNLGAQPEIVAEPPGRSQGIVRGLAIFVQNLCGCQDEIRLFLQTHERSREAARPKVAAD